MPASTACCAGTRHRLACPRRLPSPLRAHLLPLFERWQQHGLAELTGESLALTWQGVSGTSICRRGCLVYLQRNPLAGSETTPPIRRRPCAIRWRELAGRRPDPGKEG